MAEQDVAEALDRVEAVLQRRPSAGLHDDAPGRIRWDGGLRMVSTHPDGYSAVTDMPVELGGSGDGPSPGWLWRSGLAACTATIVAMTAARKGVTLDALEVEVTSRSDTRGALGMTEADGSAIYPGPQDLQMRIRIGARGTPPAALRSLVATAHRNAPMASTLAGAAMTLHVEIEDS